MIDEPQKLLVCYLFNGHIEPQHKMPGDGPY
jgi:hypothetical protein